MFSGGNNMKIKWSVSAGGGVSVFFLALIGCANPSSSSAPSSSPQYYYYELFRISKTDFNSVTAPSSPTFSAIENYRNQLKTHSVETLASGTDATQTDIYILYNIKRYAAK
jgi:hypothetical protein